MKVLQGQLRKYDDLKPDMDSLHAFSCDSDHLVDFSGKFSRNAEGRIVFDFGKHKDRIVDFDDDDILGYIEWMK